MPKYRITWKEIEANAEYSFVYEPNPELTARNPIDRLREVMEQLKKTGWYNRLGKNPIIKIEELEK